MQKSQLLLLQPIISELIGKLKRYKPPDADRSPAELIRGGLHSEIQLMELICNKE
jgi:hypothetical protein